MPTRRTEDPAVVDPQREYFNYTQKATQAFVIFDSSDIENLGRYDLLIAYCYYNNTGEPSVIGAVRYNMQRYPTVPIMGYDREPNPDIPVYPLEDTRLYCQEGDRISIDLVKRDNRRISLNNGFFWPDFYNSMVYLTQPVIPLPDDDSGLESCNCREFDCGLCDSAVDINTEPHPCCRTCCNDDGAQCDYPCPDGSSLQCPQGWSCGTPFPGAPRCCRPDDNSGGTPT